jgi:hypothetical protein
MLFDLKSPKKAFYTYGAIFEEKNLKLFVLEYQNILKPR